MCLEPYYFNAQEICTLSKTINANVWLSEGFSGLIFMVYLALILSICHRSRKNALEPEQSKFKHRGIQAISAVYLMSAVTQFFATWSESRIFTFGKIYDAFVLHKNDDDLNFFLILNCSCVVFTRAALCLNEIYFSYQYLNCYFQIKNMLSGQKAVKYKRCTKVIAGVLVGLTIILYSTNGWL